MVDEPVTPRRLCSATRLPAVTVQGDHLFGRPREGRDPAASRVSARFDLSAVLERSPSGLGPRNRRIGAEP